MELNELRDEAYHIACEHGWHDKEYSDEHFLMLIVCELAEAVEADRKARHANAQQYDSLILYALREELLTGEILDRYVKEAFENEIKDSVEDEISDVVIRCLDLAGLKLFDLPDSLTPTQAMLERIKGMTFTEWAYSITNIAVGDFLATETKITLILLNIIAKADVMNFNLWSHVKQKMEYNRSRPYKHGKQY